MRQKFKIGDKVRLNKRVPKYIQQHIRWHRTRTIVNAFYDPDKQCYYYQLGAHAAVDFGYWFRGYMLNRVTRGQARTEGRPRQKRRYRKTIVATKLLLASHNQNPSEHTLNKGVAMPQPQKAVWWLPPIVNPQGVQNA